MNVCHHVNHQKLRWDTGKHEVDDDNSDDDNNNDNNYDKDNDDNDNVAFILLIHSVICDFTLCFQTNATCPVCREPIES